MAKTKFEHFKYHLENGDLDGVKKHFEPEFLEEVVDNVFKSKPIHVACLHGYVDIMEFLIDQKCNIECETDDEWKPIHVACWNGQTEIVKLLINQNCDINSENDNKRKPIHLACWNGRTDIVRQLIAHNCQIDVMEKNGDTALDLAKKRGNVEIVKLIQEVCRITKHIHKSIEKNDVKMFAKFYKPDMLTGLNWLEMAWEKKADKIIKYFLDRPMTDLNMWYMKNVMCNRSMFDSDRLWQEVLLYKCIRDHHQEGFQLSCCANAINGERKIIRSSFLEVAARHGSFSFVHEILKKTIFDEEAWKRAKDIAVMKGHHLIKDFIINRECLLKYRQKANLSLLHTAVCDNDPDMVEYILTKNFVDRNLNHESLGTVLALAIVLCHEKCVTIFKRFKVDCHIQNKYLQSPLHEAISNGMIEHCRYLIDQVENIDQPGFLGQTALHYAVINGLEELCGQLMDKGADCIKYTEVAQTDIGTKADPLSISKRENPLTLCVKKNKTIYSCFLDKIDANKANSFDENGNTLLHLTTKLLDSKLCNALIQKGGKVDSTNIHGITPLFEMLSKLDQQTFDNNSDKIVDIVNLFVRSGCNLSKRFKDNMSIFDIAFKLERERLLLTLIPAQKDQLSVIGEELFKLAIDHRFYEFCEVLLRSVSKELFSRCISAETINMAILQGHTEFVKSLFVHVHDNVKQCVVERVLCHLAKNYDNEFFQQLLNIDVINPQRFEDGETLLTKMLKERKIQFCQMIFDSETNGKKYINMKNEKNQTPLQVAIEIESMDIVQHLIFETDKLNNEDCEGRTALMQLFVKISNNDDKERYLGFLNAIKTIICEGGDIYHETQRKYKILSFCSRPETRKYIESFHKSKLQKMSLEKEKTIKTCEICLEREIDSAFDCGHTVCQICGEQVSKCPFCGLESVRAKRIYFH